MAQAQDLAPTSAPDPAPRTWPEAVARFADGKLPFKARIERLLADIDEESADELMMLLKEGRGAWGLLLGADAGSTVLFVGDARSGTPIALGVLGLRVTVLDSCAVRVAFGRGRAEALAPGSVAFVCGRSRTESNESLPFSDGAFDACVQEPWGSDARPLGARALWRVTRREIFDVRNNRLAYKRSLGRRGAFDKGLGGFLRAALFAPSGERSLRGARRDVERGARRAAHCDAYALYPHAREFSHVVALDAETPRLTVGPRERRNTLKVIASRVGLFSWFTPSFGLHGTTVEERAPARLTRALSALSKERGIETPDVEVFVATRSNNALCLTSGSARWALHIPLQPSKRRLVEEHFRWLERVRAKHPAVRVPDALFLGECDGVYMSVEERIDGTSATAVTGDARRTAALITSTAKAFEALLDAEPTHMDEARYRSLMGERVQRVLDLAPGRATRAKLQEIEEAFRSRVLGRSFRLATYHADLRGKHVVVDANGLFRAALDWGASEASFFPLVDLLQLIVHQRKQETGQRFGDAWRSLRREEAWRAPERTALLGYADRAGLDRDDVLAWIEAFPLFVAGMAERNWDFSRPHWVARQFGLPS